MAVRIGVLQEKLFIVQMKGIVTIEETLEFDKFCINKLNSTSEDVCHFVFDAQQATSIPSMWEQTKLKAGRHHKVGRTILIGYDSKILRFIASVALQVFGLPFHFSDSIADAGNFIHTVLPEIEGFTSFADVQWEHMITWDTEGDV